MLKTRSVQGRNPSLLAAEWHLGRKKQFLDGLFWLPEFHHAAEMFKLVIDFLDSSGC
jgi:hypothetical protein